MTTAWTLRPARPEDADALRELATLDSQPPLTGATVVGEVAGELWAAADHTGRVVADPFRPSKALADAAVAGARRRHGGPRRRGSLRRRLAPA